MNYVRRFVFVQYEDLLEIRFKQLEKVTDKLYVFIQDDAEHVPLSLVRQMQKMGPDVDWIEIGDVTRSTALSILAFHIGILHEKVDLGVEFAILSDDENLDALVEHIHGTGRNCVRVKQRMKEEPQAAEASKANGPRQAQASMRVESRKGESLTASQPRISEDELDDEDEIIDLDLEELTLTEGYDKYNKFVSKANDQESRPSSKAREDVRMRQPLHPEKAGVKAEEITAAAVLHADDIVRRLIRSGNRPADISMLRSYILLHSDDAEAVRNVDQIIEHLEDAGEIRLNDGSVLYNF